MYILYNLQLIQPSWSGMDTKNTNLLNGRWHRSVEVMKSASVTWHHEKVWYQKFETLACHSTNCSHRREPEPVVITNDVTNTQTPEKDQPSSDNKMNDSRNKYIWIGKWGRTTWSDMRSKLSKTLTASGDLRVQETLNQQINWCHTFQNLKENNKWNDQTE